MTKQVKNKILKINYMHHRQEKTFLIEVDLCCYTNPRKNKRSRGKVRKK